MSAILHKKTFRELTTDELYELLRVRSETFVLGQNCVYQDQDNDEPFSRYVICHFLLVESRKAVITDTLIVMPLCGRKGVFCCRLYHHYHLLLFQLLQNRHGRSHRDPRPSDADARAYIHSL